MIKRCCHRYLGALVILLCRVLIPFNVLGAEEGSPIVTASPIPQPPTDILTIFGDSEGYIWYGTVSGLYREDGYGLKFLKPDDEADLDVSSIAETPAGDLWVATSRGVWELNKRSYKFRQVDPDRLGTEAFTFVKFTSDGNAWIGRKGVLSRYGKDGEWKNDYPLIDRRGKSTTITGLCESRGGDILMTSFSPGVYILNRKTDSFELYRPTKELVSLGELFQDRIHDYFWTRDHQGKIYRFNPSASDEGSVYIASETIAPGEPSGRHQNLRGMIQDDKYGYIWGWTRKGILLYRPEKDGHLTPVPLDVANDLEGSFLTQLYPWKGTVRVSTFGHQSIALSLDDSAMRVNRLQLLKEKFGNMPAILAMAMDPTPGFIWLLQLRSGVILYDLSTNTMADGSNLQHLRLSEGTDMTRSHVHKGIWVTQRGGRVLFALSHDASRKIFVADSLLLSDYMEKSEHVTALYEDSGARLWIATNQGLLKIDLNDKKRGLKRYSTHGIYGITEGTDHVIWAAGKRGLFRFNPATPDKGRIVSRILDLSAVAVSPEGYVWIGTDNGDVFCFNPSTGEEVAHDKNLHEDKSKIEALYADKFGHLWIVSQNNVSQYNPRNKAHRDYWAGRRGNLASYLCGIPGLPLSDELYAGGVGGLAIFTPSNMLDVVSKDMHVRLSDIKVNGKSLYFDGPQTQSIDTEPKLDRDASNIEFYFMTANGIRSEDIRFGYRLKGYDSDWNYTAPGENRGFYNKLPKGHHVLEVKVCDENNTWSGAISEIKIYRKPALYATWWAILVYIIVGVSLIIFIFAVYKKHMAMENERMWTDSKEMIKMRQYLESPVTLPEEEYRELDRVLLEKATKTVEANMSIPDFGVSDLASGVNMSKSSLARKLKAITGQTPSDFIRKIKMQYACRLLESQNHTVSEVAEMIGFDERRYFTTSFKKEIGVTPRDYLKGERPGVNNKEEGNDSDSIETKDNK